jgi:hypothetical protein
MPILIAALVTAVVVLWPTPAYGLRPAEKNPKGCVCPLATRNRYSFEMLLATLQLSN